MLRLIWTVVPAGIFLLVPNIFNIAPGFAIIISGGEDYEDKLIECGQLAIEKGFERIHIQPRYMSATPSESESAEAEPPPGVGSDDARREMKSSSLS